MKCDDLTIDSAGHLAEQTEFDEAQLKESLTAVDPNPQAALSLLLETYLEDASSLMVQVGEAAEQLDFDRLRFAAHTLKSSSALMGLMGLSKLCQQIEQHARHQSADSLAMLVSQAKTVQTQSQQLLLSYQLS